MTMTKIAITILAVAMLACGGSDTAPTGDTGETGDAPPVSATGGGSAGAPEAAPPPAPTAAAVHPQVESCLDLIRKAEFEAALPVCLAALDFEPDNQEVRDAVEQARTEAAKLAAEAVAAGVDAEDAAAGAASQVEGLTGDAAGKLTQ